MRTLASILPWFIPGVAVSVVVAFTLRRPVAGWLRILNGLAVAIVISAGAIIAATVPPDADGARISAASFGTCDFDRLGLAQLGHYLRLGDTGLNVVLFVPLGVALGLLPPSRRSMCVLMLAIGSPFLIESIQAIAPALGRGCQSADVVDNLLGLAIGVLAGGAGRRLGTAARSN